MIRIAAGILLFILAYGLAIPVKAEEATTIPVLLRDLGPGEVIGPDDLTEVTVTGRIAGNVFTEMDEMIGLAARKTLRAGRAVARSEVRQPLLVTKGSLVTIRVSMPGIELATTAKAMEQGALGEVIKVMNLASLRIVQAVITGPGMAEVPVSPQPVVLSAANPDM
ncbi:flagellar basal body P-ring formation chaperone FlgA [Zavarzinia compransoris]|uniref:Flagella basal body P-ring formation protein FlgA n=1 Tax=Zavarzinia compransoris TaxID=1264899 RepID=A0A317E409_9PROT|nr:flagellar basal body P-ring formation chaperone FlgA [Zavarzinia compransoris]PWR19795.1 flagella basal body P-ring formation protein FlgA [Zavarzinia compransoris]TDP45101.1 flagella basal body P-ring formation protein FlgA [Zavarzinia compransoris]